MANIEIANTSYLYKASIKADLSELAEHVEKMRENGRLSADELHRIRKFFKLKHIYHSNAIEGNQLDEGETRVVVAQGLTLTGKPLKDQAEARNLSDALDYLEELVKDQRPIRETDIRQLHAYVLKDIHEQAGRYRTSKVEISGSAFEPTPLEAIQSEMQALGTWLATSSVVQDANLTIDGLINAAVAHTWFVMTHPFIDGNGRVARLLMNLILMRYGFPIAIISRDDRNRYYNALEDAQAADLSSFLSLLCECVEEGLEEYEAAAKAAQERRELVAASWAKRLGEPERIRKQYEYEIWHNAMDMLKNYLRQITNDFNEASGGATSIHLRAYDSIEFEKYLAFSNDQSAKRTWFFRIDFKQGERCVRYLFWFGFASPLLKQYTPVTLHISREEPEGSHHYERLYNNMAPNVPDMIEVGYAIKKEQFVVNKRGKSTKQMRVDKLGQGFFEEVMQKHFQSC